MAITEKKESTFHVAHPGHECDACDKPATVFEEDPNHWHDHFWCDEHVEKRKAVLKAGG